LKIQQILHHQGKEQKNFYHQGTYHCMDVHIFLFFRRHSLLGPVKTWQIQDCIDVHKLLETVFGDQNVANSKFQNRCTHSVTCYIVLLEMRLDFLLLFCCCFRYFNLTLHDTYITRCLVLHEGCIEDFYSSS
jgi:hypothetical protein